MEGTLNKYLTNNKTTTLECTSAKATWGFKYWTEDKFLTYATIITEKQANQINRL